MNKIASQIAAATLAATASSTQAADIDVVRNFYQSVLSATSTPDLAERMAAVLSPDWRSIGDYASPEKTRDRFLSQLQAMGTTAPDLTWTIEEILQDGNRFIVRGRAFATPVKPFLGAIPSGKSFEIMAIDIHTVENSRIVMSYHVEDWLGALEQLKAE
ncbi:polyketide cyclase [Hahella sp. KA22]|uniref:ester cyclase n=1 Tax=Hahella sp. KA22 TaxID=1628392 RepID=UPI000FDDC01E|nr:ester cyclase [Hahella sp. KA22]AZZ92646.1 polyketide cyclase [Hahella sp. KA22]QAY56019.1 polyketide cyclase [Hahella sp. KA22]